jgi:hypothetical protein
VLNFLRNSSDENRPRIAKIARGELMRVVSEEPNSEEALLFAIITPLLIDDSRSPAAAQYWLEWATVNREVFKRQIEVLRAVIPWVGVAEYEWSSISMEQLLEDLGVRALYEFHVCGLVKNPPLVYRFLHAIQHVGKEVDIEISPFVDEYLPKGPAVSHVARELLGLLPYRQGTWLRYQDDHRVLTQAVKWLPPSLRLRRIIELLLAPPYCSAFL